MTVMEIFGQPPSDCSIIGGLCPYKIKPCINPEFYVLQISIPLFQPWERSFRPTSLIQFEK